MSELLKTREMAAKLRIDKTTLLRWVRAGKVPVLRAGPAGKRLLFDEAKVRAALGETDHAPR